MDLLLPGRLFGSSAAYAVVDGLVVVLAVLAAFAVGKGRVLAHAYSRTAAACIAVASVALASSPSRPDAASYLRLLALLSLPLIAHHRWGSAAAPLYCVLNVHRAMSAAAGGPWERVVSALLYSALMFACLDAQTQVALRALANKALYVQEIQLIMLSRQRPLVLDDVWKLPKRFSVNTLLREFKYNVEEPMFLLRATVRMMWRPMLPLITLMLLMEATDIARVVVTGYLFRCFDSSSEYPWYYGYGVVLAMLAVNLVYKQKDHLGELVEAKMSRVPGAISAELFRLPLEPNGQRKLADIVVPSGTLGVLPHFLTMTTQTGVEIVGLWAKFAALYYVVGWLALIPIASSASIMAINWGFEQLVGGSSQWSKGTRTNHDDISEVYQGIKAIKLFGWERMYLDPKLQEQDSEDKQLPWYAPAVRVAWFIIEAAFWTSSRVAAYILFYIHTQNLAASMLTSAYVLELNSHVSSLCGKVESIVHTFKNVRSWFGGLVIIERALRGRPANTLPRHDIASDESGPAVTMDGCSFKWSQRSHEQALNKVSFCATGSDLVAVAGKTGSGKSSLLLSICGELELAAGTGSVAGTIAYLEQSPWIMNDTMRANVLFGREYDVDWFAKVIYACALTDDIAVWPDADLTVIGERGVNISGGQRARLALARTLYSRADIYVLDDPISAVDAHVKRHLLEHVLLDTGLLAGKLRIITTNSGHLLPYANQVVTLTDGRAEARMQTPQEYRAIDVHEPLVELSEVAQEGDTSGSEEQPETTTDDDNSSEEQPDSQTEDPADKPSDAKRSPWENIVYTMKLCGWPAFASLALLAAIRPTADFVLDGMALDVLMNSGAVLSRSDALWYLGLQSLQILMYRVLRAVEDHIRTHVSGRILDKAIQGEFVRGIIHAPMSFFDSTTRQHVSSAYNDGAEALAKDIPEFFTEELSNIVESVLSVYRVGRRVPQVLLVAPVVAWAIHKRDKVIDSTRSMLRTINRETEIGRTRTSDVVADGKQMIRLFNVGPYFVQKHAENEDEQQQLQAPISALNSLRNTIHHMLHGVNSTTVACLMLLRSQTWGGEISSGAYTTYDNLLGTLVRNTTRLASCGTTIAEFSDHVDLYRQYTSIEPEAPYVVDNCRPPPNWPPTGKVEFRDFTLRYRADLEPALTGTSLAVQPGEKIGIVGRTGAGKSTLAKSLFRLVHGTTSGKILIDGQDISEVGVGDLCPRLGIIPQESTMFPGSFKRNLDPLQQHTVEDMWAALVKSGIAPKVAPPRARKDGLADDEDYDERYEETMVEWKYQWEKSGWAMRMLLLGIYSPPKKDVSPLRKPRHGLGRIAKSGSQGFSGGQMQLFSLSRVLMRMRRIIVLDEATADVDLETDQHMQKLFRNEFADCAVLTIAHRLETIMGSNRIVVMDKGRIAEIGAPQGLIDAGGMFAEL
ncbi:ATP-binding cassette glutathione S-conjugate transporter ycf1, partial [Coemansia spiralis]